MALIICKDCSKEFSSDAKRCPHCGAKKPLNKLIKYFLYFFGALTGFNMALMLVLSHNRPHTPPAEDPKSIFVHLLDDCERDIKRKPK